MENTNSQYDFSKLSESFQTFIGNRELMYKVFDTLPIPAEVFEPDGTSIFVNKAMLELNNIPDASLVVGKYNPLKDPVFIEIVGQEFLDKLIKGEAATFNGFPAPISDVVNRYGIDEKPWEAATMDVSFQPIWDGGKFICMISFFIVKNVYYGRADIAQAKEYIDNHWLDDFDPNAVAKSLNISLAHLRSVFKHHTGITMNDYYKKVKVDHIKEKLGNKNLSITEAFDACGVDSQGWIARVFKEMTGMSPTEYRSGLK